MTFNCNPEGSLSGFKKKAASADAARKGFSRPRNYAAASSFASTTSTRSGTDE